MEQCQPMDVFSQPNNKTAANPILRWPIGDELLAKSGGALISPSGMGVFFPKGGSCMISAHAPDRLVVSPKGATIDTSLVLPTVSISAIKCK